jgi:hypothetical protein
VRVITAVAICATICVAIAGYLAYTWLTRPRYALEVDATRDTTDISGTLYRVRVANVGYARLTNISAVMGVGDIEIKDFLDPGQTYYFYPNPDTLGQNIKVTSGEGIEVVTSYRTPTKVLGLPGGGR